MNLAPATIWVHRNLQYGSSRAMHVSELDCLWTFRYDETSCWNQQNKLSSLLGICSLNNVSKSGTEYESKQQWRRRRMRCIDSLGGCKWYARVVGGGWWRSCEHYMLSFVTIDDICGVSTHHDAVQSYSPSAPIEICQKCQRLTTCGLMMFAKKMSLWGETGAIIQRPIGYSCFMRYQCLCQDERMRITYFFSKTKRNHSRQRGILFIQQCGFISNNVIMHMNKTSCEWLLQSPSFESWSAWIMNHLPLFPGTLLTVVERKTQLLISVAHQKRIPLFSEIFAYFPDHVVSLNFICTARAPKLMIL